MVYRPTATSFSEIEGDAHTARAGHAHGIVMSGVGGGTGVALVAILLFDLLALDGGIYDREDMRYAAQ